MPQPLFFTDRFEVEPRNASIGRKALLGGWVVTHYVFEPFQTSVDVFGHVCLPADEGLAGMIDGRTNKLYVVYVCCFGRRQPMYVSQHFGPPSVELSPQALMR